PFAASRPQQKKRTIHVLQNRTGLKTRESFCSGRPDMILAGDIGGTKAMPLLAHVHQGAVEAVFEKRYPVKRRRLTIVNALPPSVTMLFNR
ncbi:MAG: hypothetical protein NT123_17800, partial [Proteobacteria bacterium]|nr:hypothetical protein [Pseudomonadota bacterium]